MIGPFAPATLPGTVKIGPGRLNLRAVPPYEIAAAMIGDPQALLARLVPAEEWRAVQDAADSPDIPLIDRPYLMAAGAGVAARLCGQEPTLLGWRWAIRLCYLMFGDGPPGGWSLVVDRGIDPSTAPLWVSCAAVWSTLTRSAERDKVAQLRRDFAAPLAGERAWAWAMPRIVDPVEAEHRSDAARRRRAVRNVRAVRALRSGQIR